MSAHGGGGPAFPVIGVCQNQATGETTIFQGEGGITARDYFAAQALVGVLSHAYKWRAHDFVPRDGCNVIENNALLAYEYADAMLKARSA